MSKSYIPVEIRRQVTLEAKERCGYCLTTTMIIGRPMVIDHILPEAKGGSNEIDNLWLACRRCNEFKGARTDFIDPQTGLVVPLFNPREQSWTTHFRWQNEGTLIAGLTESGRATVEALQLNNEEIIGARYLWMSVGWHPPKDSIV